MLCFGLLYLNLFCHVRGLKQLHDNQISLKLSFLPVSFACPRELKNSPTKKKRSTAVLHVYVLETLQSFRLTTKCNALTIGFI